MKNYYCFCEQTGSFIAEDFNGPTSGSTKSFSDESIYKMTHLKDAINFRNSYHSPLTIYKVTIDEKSSSASMKLEKVIKDEIFAVAKEKFNDTLRSNLNAAYIVGEDPYLNAELTDEAKTKISNVINDALEKALSYVEIKRVGSFD